MPVIVRRLALSAAVSLSAVSLSAVPFTTAVSFAASSVAAVSSAMSAAVALKAFREFFLAGLAYIDYVT